MYLEKAKLLVRKLNFVPQTDFIPCTKEQIDALEHKVKLRLPEAYKEFLTWMGQGAGLLLRGSDCFYHHLPMQEDAFSLLKENGSQGLMPESAYVFLMHQGYLFLFFRTDEGEDPSIYCYNETEDASHFTRVFDSFSQFLMFEIEETVKLKIRHNIA